MTKEYSDFLAHYGVKGQKKGHRRYQNEDGSLTPEGRQHYGVEERQPGSGAQSVKSNGVHVKEGSSAEASRQKKTYKPITPEQKARNRKICLGIIAAAGAISLAKLGTTALRNRVRSSEMKRFTQAVNRMAVDSRFTTSDLTRFTKAGTDRINNINRRQAIGYTARNAVDFVRHRFRRR